MFSSVEPIGITESHQTEIEKLRTEATAVMGRSAQQSHLHVVEVESSIKEAESVHEELQNTMSSKEDEVKELKAKLEACLQDAQKWEKEWSEATALYQKAEREKKEMERELMAKRDDRESLEKRENEIQLLSEELKAAEKAKEEMERELEEARKAMEAAEKEEMEKAKEEMEKAKEEMEKEKEETEKELEAVKKENETLKSEKEKESQEEMEKEEVEKEEIEKESQKEKEESSVWQAERNALLEQIETLKAQTAQQSQQLATLLAEESVEDTSLSATPSLPAGEDDFSSVFTFTTMSSNPYAQRAIQKQNELLAMSLQQLRAHDSARQTAIVNLKQTLDSLNVELHKRELVITELKATTEEQNKTIETYRETIAENTKFMTQQAALNEENSAMMSEMKERLKAEQERAEQERAEREKSEKEAKEAKATAEKEAREAKASLEALTAEKAELEKEASALKAALEAKEAELAALAQEAEREETLSVQSYHSAAEEATGLASKEPLTEVTFELMDGRDPIRLRLPLAENEAEVTVLRDLLSECQTSTETYRNNVLEERRKSARLQGELDKVTAKELELQGKLALQRVTLETEAKERASCEAARAAAVAEKEAKAKALEEEKAAREALEKEAATLRERVATLESSLETKASSIDQTRAELSASQNLLSSKAREVDAKQTELAEQQRAREALEKKCAELERQAEAKAASYHGLVEKYNALGTRAKAMVQETKEQLTAAYQQQVNQVSAQLAQKEEELAALRKKYSDAMAIVESLHQRSGGHGGEEEEMRAMVEGYKKELERMKKRLAKKQVLNQQLNTYLNEKEAELKALYDKVKQ